MPDTFDWREASVGALLVCCMAAIFVWGICWAGTYFIALSSPPKRRAFWTASAGYIGTAVLFLFAVPADWWGAPLVPIPAALAAYFYLLRGFRSIWYEDHAQIPEGVAEANTAWRKGILVVLAAVATAIASKLPLALAFHH